jgi:hypothetical protein
MADILAVPISFFFDGLTPGSPEEIALRERMEQPETLELIRLYYAFRDRRVREQFLELVKAVAERVPRREAAAQHRPGRRARR